MESIISADENIILKWTFIIDKFAETFKTIFVTKSNTAYLDCLDSNRTVEGATLIWSPILMLDAILFFHLQCRKLRSNSRKFNQQSLLKQAILDGIDFSKLKSASNLQVSFEGREDSLNWFTLQEVYNYYTSRVKEHKCKSRYYSVIKALCGKAVNFIHYHYDDKGKDLNDLIVEVIKYYVQEKLDSLTVVGIAKHIEIEESLTLSATSSEISTVDHIQRIDSNESINDSINSHKIFQSRHTRSGPELKKQRIASNRQKIQTSDSTTSSNHASVANNNPYQVLASKLQLESAIRSFNSFPGMRNRDMLQQQLSLINLNNFLSNQNQNQHLASVKSLANFNQYQAGFPLPNYLQSSLAQLIQYQSSPFGYMNGLSAYPPFNSHFNYPNVVDNDTSNINHSAVASGLIDLANSIDKPNQKSQNSSSYAVKRKRTTRK